MATREELYRAFGPKLIEAIVRITRNEINALRTHAGLSERTDQQILNAVSQELASMPDYDWMTEVEP